MATPEALEPAESVPQVAPEQPVPLNDQFTPRVCKSFVTVAVNVCVRLVVTFAEVGATLTLTAGTIVIAAEKLALGSAMDVALIVTIAGEGTVAGAV